MQRPELRSIVRLLAVVLTSLVGATIVVWLLQDVIGVRNPSAVYLVAVVVSALASGPAGAVVASIGAFLAYDFLFVEPRFTFTIHDPAEYVSVVLLLFVGIVVGQLAALQRTRTQDARDREREAHALFTVSRDLATRDSVDAVLPHIAARLQQETRMRRVAISLGAADSARAPDWAQTGLLNQLRRMPGDVPAQWVRVHQPGSHSRGPTDADTYRIAIDAGGSTLGALWALRDRAAGLPTRDETRLLSAAADQLGQAIAHDRLAADAQAAELARESDALKSALLQSVSHDLRTPLATIRAAAGTLRGASDGSESGRESVAAIEREVEYLNRLVTNLLDLSRIEAGVLHAGREQFELDDAIGATLERLGPRLAEWRIENAAGREVVSADPVFVDAVLSNVLENVMRHTPAGTKVRISTSAAASGFALLTIEDDGPGVPEHDLDRLFDKFFRVAGQRATRHGTGIGLAVARGLVEAMGGHIAARRSALGGLAIDIELPLAVEVPRELELAAR